MAQILKSRPDIDLKFKWVAAKGTAADKWDTSLITTRALRPGIGVFAQSKVATMGM